MICGERIFVAGGCPGCVSSGCIKGAEAVDDDEEVDGDSYKDDHHRRSYCYFD